MSWRFSHIDQSGTGTVIVVVNEKNEHDIFNFAFDQGGDYLERFIQALTTKIQEDEKFVLAGKAVLEAEWRSFEHDGWDKLKIKALDAAGLKEYP